MIEVKQASHANIDAIVMIHELAFPKFFLTTLGSGFLRLYYKSMCKCKEALTLCAFEDGKVVGFSTTALKSAGFNTRLIKNNIVLFMLEAVKLLFTKPRALIHLANNMTKSADGVNDAGDFAELYSIGVIPACQGKGVGGLLLSENERIIRSWGGGKIIINNR